MSASSTLRIAWRNLGRNRVRTGLALAAIAVGQFAVVLYSGVMRGYADSIRAIITGPFVGDIQVQHRDWRVQRASDLVLDDADGLASKFRRSPLVEAVSVRVLGGCLAVVGEEKAQEAKPALVVGIEPAEESGSRGLLAGVPSGRVRARFGPNDLGGGKVLLGGRFARSLGAGPGDRIDLIGNTADGFLAADRFVVAGVLETPVAEVDARGVVMSLDDARRFFEMPGQAHQIVLRTKPGVDIAALAAEFARDPAAAGVEVISWREAQPVMAAASDFMEYANLFMLGLLMIAVIAGITNTLMMSVFERLHELGMLLGLGMRPGRIVSMMLAEAALLGLLGAAAGTAFGAASVAGMAQAGVDIMGLGGGSNDVTFGGIAMPVLIFPRIEAADILVGLATVLLTSLAAAAWPATYAARLEPREVLSS